MAFSASVFAFSSRCSSIPAPWKRLCLTNRLRSILGGGRPFLFVGLSRAGWIRSRRIVSKLVGWRPHTNWTLLFGRRSRTWLSLGTESVPVLCRPGLAFGRWPHSTYSCFCAVSHSWLFTWRPPRWSGTWRRPSVWPPQSIWEPPGPRRARNRECYRQHPSHRNSRERDRASCKPLKNAPSKSYSPAQQS